MATLTLAIAVAAAFGMVAVLWQCWRLVDAVHTRGIGRIFYVSLASVYTWVSLVVGYFLTNSFDPDLMDDGRGADFRDVVRLFFAVYLLGQTAATVAAITRWNREGRQ